MGSLVHKARKFTLTLINFAKNFSNAKCGNHDYKLATVTKFKIVKSSKKMAIAASTLNFLSPSLVADILLHPFDFATVLLQIGFDPDGIKHETTTLMSLTVQCALCTFYIPYLLTSMQGLQVFGMPHPSILYYINYIYSKEGFKGCYRGLMPKICERLIMLSVNEKVRHSINKDTVRSILIEAPNAMDQENFLETIINGICSQFFAVLISHPFHVIMVSSFAEFTYNKKSSLLELFRAIYTDDGYFGFFTGLTARLLGELLSLIFSITYTTIINNQMRPQQTIPDSSSVPSVSKTTDPVINYVTDISRPKSTETEEIENTVVEESSEPCPLVAQRRFSQFFATPLNFLRNNTQTRIPERAVLVETRLRLRYFQFLAYIPLTSRIFYYIIIRDFLSKKISNPFFLVCHCAIVLDTGWDKFPLLIYLEPFVDFVRVYLTPSGGKGITID